jgi:cytochrome o ubiquinol oxidase operon protein cyoD
MKLTRATYTIGFILSLVTTLAAYDVALLYAHGVHTFSPGAVVGILFALACMQFIVQAICFLHLSVRPKEKEKLYLFLYACALICMLVVGSVWIMLHLNNRMMLEPQEMYQYMNRQTGI